MISKYFKYAFVIASCLAAVFVFDSGRQNAQVMPKPAEPVVKMPDVITLAKGSKQGDVTFNHVSHNSGEYSVAGPIFCIACHHTAQPAAELAKHPPLKTEWPVGRTTTLTLELFNKDPNAAGIARCRDCHARAGEKPKLLAATPVMKDPGSPTITTMTNQLAFHRTCDACHFQIAANRSDTKVPNAIMCKSCHVKPS